MRPPREAALALLVAAVGCVASLSEQARRAAGEGVDPDPVIDVLEGSWDAIDSTKRIFDVTLIEGRRRFAGEGAAVYRAEPRRLRADVFGPHDTAVLHVDLVGDSLTVRLPREGEVLSGRLGDPAFARQAGERALASPEALGALIGAYDVRRLLDGADRVSAAKDGERRTLYILADGTVHALTLATPSGPLVEYRQAVDGRLVYRARFERFHRVAGRESPWKTVLRDYPGGRTVVVEVRSEREATDGEI